MLLTITFYLAAFFLLVPFIAEIFVFIHFRHHFHHIPWHFIRIIYRLGFNHLWMKVLLSSMFSLCYWSLA